MYKRQVYSEEGLTQVVGCNRARHRAGDVPLWVYSQQGGTVADVKDRLIHIERELLSCFESHWYLIATKSAELSPNRTVVSKVDK